MKKSIMSVAMAAAAIVLSATAFAQAPSITKFSQALDNVEREYWTSMCGGKGLMPQINELMKAAKEVNDDALSKKLVSGCIILRKIYEAGPYKDINVENNVRLVKTIKVEKITSGVGTRTYRSEGDTLKKEILLTNRSAFDAKANKPKVGIKDITRRNEIVSKYTTSTSYADWLTGVTNDNLKSFEDCKNSGKMGVNIFDYFKAIKSMREAIDSVNNPSAK